MSSQYIKYPKGVPTYANAASFPLSSSDGDLAIALDSHDLYEYEIGVGWVAIAGPGVGGSVSSVALSAPVEFVVSGSPITTAGTLTLTKAVEPANTVYAGPTSGGSAQPTFRALVAADLPIGAISPLTTKGDLYGFSTVNARIPIGSNGQVLTVDSTQVLGLKWATLPSTSPGGISGNLQYNNAGAFAGYASTDGTNTTFSGIVLINDPTAYFSNPGTGSESEKFGAGSQASGFRCIAIGFGANAADDDATVIGHNASGNISSIAVGSGATANNGAVAIGADAQANDTNACAIGPGASADSGLAFGPSTNAGDGGNIVIAENSTAQLSSGTIIIGSNIDAGVSEGLILIGDSFVNDIANNSMLFGIGGTLVSNNVCAIGNASPNQLTKLYLGYGEVFTDSEPQSDFYISPSYILDATDGFGTNLNLDGGNGTGTGGSGSVILRTAPASTSGSTANAYVTRLTATSTGEVTINGALALTARNSVNLTADNQVVTVNDSSHIVLSSDNATPTNRTFTLTSGLSDGHTLIIEWSGTNQGEIAATSNCRLPSTMQFTQYDTLMLIWSSSATAWLQLSRSANA